MKYRLTIALAFALGLFLLIIHLGIVSFPARQGDTPSSTVSVPATPSSESGTVVPVAPLPSVNQSMRFWADAEAHGRLDTNLAVKRYFFDLAMNHRIPVTTPAGATLGEVVVPGDVANLNWNATTTQETRLADSGVPVDITPDMLQELKRRRDRLIALGAPQ
jgi:hypothetical protein